MGTACDSSDHDEVDTTVGKCLEHGDRVEGFSGHAEGSELGWTTLPAYGFAPQA
jgi:hypothetical protein